MKRLKFNRERHQAVNPVHLELRECFADGLKGALYINFVVWTILLIGDVYPRGLASFDASIAILFVLFLTVLFPLMLSGKIPAYYKHRYGASYFLAIGLPIVLSSPVRVIGTYGVLFLNIALSDTAAQKRMYLNRMIHYLYNPQYNLLALTVFLVFVIVLFYIDRFSRITEYGKKMTAIYVSFNYQISEKDCYDKFVFSQMNPAKTKRATILQESSMRDISKSKSPACKTNGLPDESSRTAQSGVRRRARKL